VRQRLELLQDRLTDLTMTSEQKAKEDLSATQKTMHKMLQEQANQIETLASTLKKRISLHAPTDYHIKMAKKLSAVD
jgi:hypothetical protein